MPEAVEVPQSAAPTPKANASAPPAAVEVPPSAEFTFVASREPTPLPLRPNWFAHTLTYLSKSDWPDYTWKSS